MVTIVYCSGQSVKFLTCPIDISVIFCLHIVSNGNAQHTSTSWRMQSYHKTFFGFVPEVAELYLGIINCGGSSCAASRMHGWCLWCVCYIKGLV